MHLRLQRRLVLQTRLAQARGEIDETRRHHQTSGLQGALRHKVQRHLTDGDDTTGSDENIGNMVEPARRVDDTSAPDKDPHAAPPISRFITAIRTAMPKVTCGRITACGPSATAESISTPRFIGPGCMTIASGAAKASFSGVSP